MKDLFQVRAAYALARTRYHGWADFVGSDTIAPDNRPGVDLESTPWITAAAAISDRMAKGEAAGLGGIWGYLGIRPSLFGETGTGRLSWGPSIDGDGDPMFAVYVHRPFAAAVLLVELGPGGGVGISHGNGTEPWARPLRRHVEVALWVAEILLSAGGNTPAEIAERMEYLREWGDEIAVENEAYCARYAELTNTESVMTEVMSLVRSLGAPALRDLLPVLNNHAHARMRRAGLE
jgi:hypothetical protein